MLTDTKLKKALGKRRDEIEVVADTHGLNARISQAGKVTFFYRYRWDNKAVKLNIGEYPSMSIAQARERRQQFRGWLVDGFDPRERVKLERIELVESLTTTEAFSYWIEKYCRPSGLAKTDYYLQVFNKHISPALGDVKIDGTSRKHWVSVFDSIDSRVMAHYMVSLCKRAFRFCLNREAIKSNPLEGVLPSDVGSKPKRKDRVLSSEELKTIHGWLKFRQTPEAKLLIKFVMLTGCRTAEIRQAKWSWFNFDEMTWTIPEKYYKTRKAIRRAIPASAIRLLEAHRARVNTQHVLTSPRKVDGKASDTPILPQVAANFARSARDGAKMDDWSLHDFRRTLATTLSELGCPPHVVEKILGHQMVGVMAHYNLHDYLDDQRHWIDIWDKHLESVFGEPMV
ncbi:tyrosine-type recombinase/integrase [Cedecea davisae]|uniref:Tyrosine-type recombinase/integrase n=1 Tax=Cedecea davisae TaxID=158484 RepID=A0ABS6DH69_9ENTR|nr:site-specific integrase [Cedecea davisae]MBU4682551.1 tyrosine-type recombinase/integrase [Cedecea davisae]MBU4687619.1 tyrosine-type recombinase/integrase [Cedecea davisae]